MITRSLLALLLIATPSLAQQPSRSDYHQLGHAILRELIETNTTASVGNTTVAAEQLQVRFKDAGFAAEDDQVVGPTPKNRNLVVRYRGTGAHKPVLLLAHLDVVEAKRDDWTYDPFVLTEKDGYYYGRGTQDVKGGAAMLVTALLRMKQEKFVPDRDFILALTAGEEGGMPYNGVQWLIANKKSLVDAEYVINVDAGGGELENGKHTLFDIQAAEKVFHSVSLTARNPGGHSSLPRKDNAIYELAAALGRVGAYEFPAKPNDVVKKYFTQAASTRRRRSPSTCAAVGAGTATPAAIARLSATPLYNALMRTTCVATMLTGGHARERAAAIRHRDGQLPHASRRRPRGRRAGSGPRDRRHRSPSRANRYCEAEPRVAPPAGRLLGGRSVREGGLGERADRADHGNRRDRRTFSPQCRRPRLRVQRPVHRHERCARARKGRAHPRFRVR